jgi:hypothetical protein
MDETMSDEKYQNLSDLNEVALKEFMQLVESDEGLLPEWKQAIIELIQNGIPQNLDALEAIIWRK